MPHFDERHFIERTQHGDTEAFTPLVTTYQSRLYTHILGRIKDVETAKDLTQETWIKAFRAINTFRADASFYSWLYRIAENVCIDYYRKQKVARIIEPIHDIDERRI
ncbi:MAG: sigma-70 family RNA polymerase sigma factor, partial [Candidatus Poribacteria bacterium]|nr:sigma-70 family RNA polymerase sigma factor [Candidatus Poribacteria bacterium]